MTTTSRSALLKDQLIPQLQSIKDISLYIILYIRIDIPKYDLMVLMTWLQGGGRSYLLCCARFELHLLGAGDVVQPRGGGGGVGGARGAPHRRPRRQVAAVPDHRDLDGPCGKAGSG